MTTLGFYQARTVLLVSMRDVYSRVRFFVDHQRGRYLVQYYLRPLTNNNRCAFNPSKDYHCLDPCRCCLPGGNQQGL